MSCRLSILIPTYQRSKFLIRLLLELERQMVALQDGVVEVIIADNCSGDNSYDLAETFATRNSGWTAIRHSSNMGAERNILFLLEKAKGQFFWIIGDDDLPRQGLVPLLLDELLVSEPSLLYLPSSWAPRIETLDFAPLVSIEANQYLPLEFAGRHHVWTTFISSWVINADHLFAAGVSHLDIEYNLGSNLIQLGWILPLIMNPASTLAAVGNTCILATAGNSGGYNFLNTFCINYPDLVSLYTSARPTIERALISPFIATKLPIFILGSRLGAITNHQSRSKATFAEALKRMWRYPSFWLLCVPAFLIPTGMLKVAKKIKHVFLSKEVNV